MQTPTLPNKNGENRQPNSTEITKSAPPASRQDMGKIRISKPQNEDQQSKNTVLFVFTFLLPVPGGRVHELVHSVLQNTVFLKSAVVTYQKPMDFAKK